MTVETNASAYGTKMDVSSGLTFTLIWIIDRSDKMRM